jgi:flavin-dependent dehydrogenase
MGVIPSFTGEGMSIALHSGCLAATAYLRHRRASTIYHQQMRADIRRQIRLAFLLNKAARQHLGQAAIFALCRTWPSIMRHVASFTRVREASMQRALARP